jgi:predicted DNA-binding ribbon-helix-helix protein
MKSSVVKRSIVIAGHKTSISLEDAFWSHLKDIAHSRQATLSRLVTDIDQTREHGNLSSAIRVFVLEYFRAHVRFNPESSINRAGGQDESKRQAGDAVRNT